MLHIKDLLEKTRYKPCFVPTRTATSYEDVRRCIARQLSFKYGYSKIACTHRVCGYYMYTGRKDIQLYHVYSYGTLILTVRLQEVQENVIEKTVMYFNNNNFSVTTSKLQRMIKQIYSIPIKMVNVGKRKEILKEYRGIYYNFGEYWN